MKKTLILILAVAAFIVACKHQIINPGNNGGSGNGSDTSSNGNGNGNGGGSGLVCFESQVLPIFQTSCAKSGCHDAGTKAEGYVLNSYANITRKGIKPGDPQGSKLYTVIASGEMPPRGYPDLTKDQKDVIYQWILEGAQNTTNCTACDTSIYTYSGAVQGIISDNCIGCHSSSLASGGVDLSTYGNVQKYALNGHLLGTIQHQPGYSPMPQGGNMLSDCNITQIQKWINSGALNN